MATQPLLIAPNGFKSFLSGGANAVVPGNPPIIAIDRGMVWLDNYFFFVGTSSSNGNDPNNAIYNSSYTGDPYGPWDTTSTILAQINPGEISWLDKHHNYLVAFCTNTIEFFYDAGNGLGSPLARQPLYAKNIGILNCGITGTVAKDKDDLYFIGKNNNNLYEVYKLSQFQCVPIGTHYVREVLNYFGSATHSQIYGIETISIDTHTMIMISFYGSSGGVTGGTSPFSTNQALVYFPEENVWWTITTTDIWQGGNTRSNWATASEQSTTTQRPYWISGSVGGTTISINSNDFESTISNTASYFTEVIDMDTNHWKHISKLHSIGDYGTNVLTLWYSNDPTFNTFTQTTTKYPQLDGYQNAIWWDNVTRFRRGSFRLDMTGLGDGRHKAFDIEYNIGST